MEIVRKYKYLIAALLILLVGGAGYYLSYNVKISQKDLLPDIAEKDINFKLLIDTGSGKYDFSVTIKEGVTVFDVLKKISSENNFSFVYQEGSLGAFVEEIYGVKNEATANKYWMFKVNGRLANEGASSLKVNNNDIIEWYYGEVSGY